MHTHTHTHTHTHMERERKRISEISSDRPLLVRLWANQAPSSRPQPALKGQSDDSFHNGTSNRWLERPEKTYIFIIADFCERNWKLMIYPSAKMQRFRNWKGKKRIPRLIFSRWTEKTMLIFIIVKLHESKLKLSIHYNTKMQHFQQKKRKYNLQTVKINLEMFIFITLDVRKSYRFTIVLKCDIFSWTIYHRKWSKWTNKYLFSRYLKTSNTFLKLLVALDSENGPENCLFPKQLNFANLRIMLWITT